MDEAALLDPAVDYPVVAKDVRSMRFVAIELAAVVFTLACVWLTANAQVACWPVGIVGCLLYLIVFGRARLYSDVLLQFYFLVTSIYGWYHWSGDGAADAVLHVTRLTPTAWLLWAAAGGAGAAVLGTIMKRYTRAALPYADAVIMSLSLVAQYFLTVKVIESWAIWIAVDVLAIGVYFLRRLYLSCLLYGVLLVLAIFGLIEWLSKL